GFLPYTATHAFLRCTPALPWAMAASAPACTDSSTRCTSLRPDQTSSGVIAWMVQADPPLVESFEQTSCSISIPLRLVCKHSVVVNLLEVDSLELMINQGESEALVLNGVVHQLVDRLLKGIVPRQWMFQLPLYLEESVFVGHGRPRGVPTIQVGQG